VAAAIRLSQQAIYALQTAQRINPKALEQKETIMGIKKVLARRGAVGSTARWAAKGYFSFVGQNPTATLSDVLRFLVSVRYGIDAKGHEEILLNMVDKKEIRGLAHLVTLILIAEAGFSENTRENQSIFRDVIMEELESQSVPSDFIHQLSF
jgi:hypothetical protein